MSTQKPYGFIYDKQGNLKEVSAPINSNFKPVKKHKKIKTGALHSSVGFSIGEQKKY
jgi:hypothetical protein